LIKVTKSKLQATRNKHELHAEHEQSHILL